MRKTGHQKKTGNSSSAVSHSITSVIQQTIIYGVPPGLKHIALIFGCALFLISCKPEVADHSKTKAIGIDSLLTIRYRYLLQYPLDSTAFPRSFSKETNTVKKVGSNDWTSGFFPGNLWQIHQLTGKKAFCERAREWTAYMEREKHNDGTHDMGFKILGSFGKGLISEHHKTYEDIIVESARTLGTRFNGKVGSLRSWDWNREVWEFPVIIDNMMNLELLFEASRISGDSSFYQMAVRHSNTVLKNHLRADNSTYHVVVYDTLTGAVKEKVTHQGLKNGSTWARGQAWAIYGFTMAFRYTKDSTYLGKAQDLADYYLAHDRLPESGIPYWDFDDPSIPKAPRDVSAATITASALYELYGYSGNGRYLEYADRVLHNLKTEEYLLARNIKAPFILDHSTGNKPKNDEIDAPLVYADYYFLEALLRKRALGTSPK